MAQKFSLYNYISKQITNTLHQQDANTNLSDWSSILGQQFSDTVLITINNEKKGMTDDKKGTDLRKD